MLHFIIRKIENKKMLNVSLLLGVTLLSAFLCVYPMFREGSLNRLLQTMFSDHIKTEAEFPAVISKNGLLEGDNVSVDAALEKMDEYKATWDEYIDVPVVQNEYIVAYQSGAAEKSFGERTGPVRFGYMPQLNEYTDLLFGERAEDAVNSDNPLVISALSKGACPCVISQSCMDRYSLVVGEELKISNLFSESEDVSLVVTGIIEEKEEDSYFFHFGLDEYSETLFLPKEYLQKLLDEKKIDMLMYTEAVMYDYTGINHSKAKSYASYLTQFRKLDRNLNENFLRILTSYSAQEQSVNTILITFELPIVALLLFFLYMISRRILEMETTEIARLKSRGVKRGKILGVYVTQSSIIALAGCLLGLPLGFGMCRLAACSNAFLSFEIKDVSIYKPIVLMLPFAGIAFVLAVLFMTIPVIRLSNLTITDRKKMRLFTGQKPFWEKYYLDLVLLAVSSYLLYNYYKQRDVMAADIISGGSVDPIVFLDSTLFILSCGLTMLRLMGYLVRLIYRIRKKHWKPAAYIGFLQIIRGAGNQGFISVFLVLTIAMGIFNAGLARTVNENMQQRVNYNAGTDLRLSEKWKIRIVRLDTGEYLWSYKEPDFERYEALNELGVLKRTRVIMDENTDFTIGKKVEKQNVLMAINTKEFGETASLSGDLNDRHWYYYLNELSQQPNGCIISSNLAEKYDLKVGDDVSYSRYSPINPKYTYVTAKLTVCGIVDAFPGFESTVYQQDENHNTVAMEKYLMVANYQTVVNSCFLTPYSVWMKLRPDADTEEILQRLDDMGLEFKNIINRQELVEKQKNSAMIQITNGMFSIGFIVSLLVCAVGFLIYWILTIREREMLYGIYRAMGLSMKEVVRMLVIEQLFGSFLSALAGFGVGMCTTFLFTRLISIVYLPQKHNIPIELYITVNDGLRIFVIIAITFTVCFLIMRKTIKDMNITKAIKMGED